MSLGPGQGYGYLWCTFGSSGHPAYAAVGSEGQFVLADPHRDLVVVITSDIDGGTADPVTNPELIDEVLKVVIPALKR
jgi:CubicO group peptidase (beta-lactamase class C family)